MRCIYIYIRSHKTIIIIDIDNMVLYCYLLYQLMKRHINNMTYYDLRLYKQTCNMLPTPDGYPAST